MLHLRQRSLLKNTSHELDLRLITICGPYRRRRLSSDFGDRLPRIKGGNVIGNVPATRLLIARGRNTAAT